MSSNTGSKQDENQPIIAMDEEKEVLSFFFKKSNRIIIKRIMLSRYIRNLQEKTPS